MKKLIGELIAALIIVIVVSLMVWAVVAIWQGNRRFGVNEWYEINDGWFTYYANKATGEKKFELEDGDILVERELDDFAGLGGLV